MKAKSFDDKDYPNTQSKKQIGNSEVGVEGVDIITKVFADSRTNNAAAVLVAALAVVSLIYKPEWGLRGVVARKAHPAHVQTAA